MAFIAFMAFMVLMFAFVISAIQTQSWTMADQFFTYLDAIIYYIGNALDIVWLFVPQGIAVICMTLCITGFYIKHAYKFIIWVLRKIPFLHIS